MKRDGDPATLFSRLVAEGFLPLLPIRYNDSLPKLKTGLTPIYQYTRLGNDALGFELFLKDDSQNPSYSFKDRASAVVSAWAGENGIGTLIAASTGNAGSSLACICAAQGQRAVIFVPASAPVAKLTQIMMYGATIVPVDGNYDQAFDLSVQATERFGWYNRNTAYNPLTIEGKKTVSFELFHDLGQQLPDTVFVPAGDGVILSGVYKGFEDLLNLGITEKMPQIVAVQAEGSNNLIRNIHTDQFKAVPSSTIADSISVDVPRNLRMAAAYLKKYSGSWVIVTDAEILEASITLSRLTGLFAEPAAAAAVAGMLKFRQQKRIQPLSKNVVLLTGSGLKDLNSVQSAIRIPDPVKPTIEAVEKLLKLSIL
jgi:threonine synthase